MTVGVKTSKRWNPRLVIAPYVSSSSSHVFDLLNAVKLRSRRSERPTSHRECLTNLAFSLQLRHVRNGQSVQALKSRARHRLVCFEVLQSLVQPIGCSQAPQS